MTKKDGDRLRQMRGDLMRMSTEYRPLGVEAPPKEDEASAMWNIAEAIDLLLRGQTVRMEVRMSRDYWQPLQTARR